MRKRILGILLAISCMACFAHAQGKVSVAVSGNNRGSVPSVELNGTTYVDVQKMARKVGAGVELFAQAKQAKVTARGFYAILTAPLSEIIVNGNQQKLKSPVVIRGGVIMVPVSFFTLPSLQKALQKEISFSNDTLWIERPFDLERIENVVNSRENEIVFASRKQEVRWSLQEPNKHTLTITLPGVTLKRDEHFRFRTDFISSADLYQDRDQVLIKIILGKSAKVWDMSKQGNTLRLRVAATAAKTDKQPEPPLPKESPVTTVTPTENVADSTLAIPSVLAEQETENLAHSTAQNALSAVESKDDFEEMFPSGADTPVMKADHDAPVSDTPVLQAAQAGDSAPIMKADTNPGPSNTPVFKAEPQPVSISAKKRKIRIVVDPGHGGKDAGAVRGRYKEKEWNLLVGNELVKLLKKGGFEVKVTRSTDVFIALGERARISNEFKADLFVSIHTNASKNKNANGFQVYFRSEKATDKEAAETAALENEAMQYEEAHTKILDALLQSMVKNEFINESSKLAGYVRNAVYKQPGIGIAVNQNNSVRQANFYVLKGVQSPSILVEMGFISNQKDRARLSNKSAREKMALGIYNGIVNYTKKEIKK